MFVHHTPLNFRAGMKRVTVSGLASFDAFTQARKALFNKLQAKDANGVVEVFDLREFKPEIVAYANAYNAVLSEIREKLKAATSDGQINNLLNSSHKFSRLDTIHLRVGDAENVEQLVLIAPTHPIKLLWLLQYQQLLFGWAEKLEGLSESEAAEMVSREAHERITSLNIPPALAFKAQEIYVNSDNLDFYWSILPHGNTADVRKTVSTVMRLLGFKLNQGEITVISPGQIADRIWRYLKHHPYVTTLRIDVINPGDGLLVLNAIREIQKVEEFKDLNYDVAFYADQRYEMMGSAFDEMTEGGTPADGRQPDVDEELLRPNKNPLFPKLTFSKRKVTENDWRTTDLREAHITILIDRFSTRVLTRQTQPPLGSFCLHNLLAEYRADFDLKGDSATWSRKVVPNQNEELTPGDTCTQALFQAVDSLTTHAMRVFAVVDEAHKLSYEETLTELIREARKYGVGILLASQSVKDFDRVVFDMVGTKVALQLEGDDAKVMSENLGLVDKQERDIARTLVLNQAPHIALIRSNRFEPYIQAEITPFYKKKN